MITIVTVAAELMTQLYFEALSEACDTQVEKTALITIIKLQPDRSILWHMRSSHSLFQFHVATERTVMLSLATFSM